ncbi:hypothetical protein RFI_13399 [Reticulomyxa filosa]|uniref:Transmembrane protein n=1 Tax=Reticulomyxa filosa TaxID=46433 RepID=X6NCS4_RETFI|nr:hypothetical protein RFI_13399 [Reticulomyxa filosa]|eukprot:ETO23776.1 hypothetical protein RFI_13399 [Reticulomyxa filosa]
MDGKKRKKKDETKNIQISHTTKSLCSKRLKCLKQMEKKGTAIAQTQPIEKHQSNFFYLFFFFCAASVFQMFCQKNNWDDPTKKKVTMSKDQGRTRPKNQATTKKKDNYNITKQMGHKLLKVAIVSLSFVCLNNILCTFFESKKRTTKTKHQLSKNLLYFSLEKGGKKKKRK